MSSIQNRPIHINFIWVTRGKDNTTHIRVIRQVRELGTRAQEQMVTLGKDDDAN